MQEPVLSVSNFVAALNQVLEASFPSVLVEGEVSEFRISKNRWVYFKLKDEISSIQCFMSVYQLNTAIEDGMKIIVRGNPRLHDLYGFSLNIRTLTPSGEGDLKRAFELLKAKLEGEGLFDESRKRPLPTFPKRLGIVSSTQAAGYADFIKIVAARWGGLDIEVADVQVQGEVAPDQIARAIDAFNEAAQPADILVIIRGGGSLDDLQAFNTETVARAVAASRIPTLVGVGHETDVTLADLAADMRASTPSNAAEIVVPDRVEVTLRVDALQRHTYQLARQAIGEQREYVEWLTNRLVHQINHPKERVNSLLQQLQLAGRMILEESRRQRRQFDVSILAMGNGVTLATREINQRVARDESLLRAYDPRNVLKRGYSVLRRGGRVVSRGSQLKPGDQVVVELSDSEVEAEVEHVSQKDS